MDSLSKTYVHRPSYGRRMLLAVLMGAIVILTRTSVDALEGDVMSGTPFVADDPAAEEYAPSPGVLGAAPLGPSPEQLQRFLSETHATYVHDLQEVESLSEENRRELPAYRGALAVRSSSSSLSSTSASISSSDPESRPSSLSSSTASPDSELTTLRARANSVIPSLPPRAHALMLRLLTDLTLTRAGQAAVLLFIAEDLPALSPTASQDEVFHFFKTVNGAELMKIGLAPNADVDPKDWYAESALTLHRLGVMKGSGMTGLFEADRPMSQVELARTLANALTVIFGPLPHSAAPPAQSYRTWPEWGKAAVSELRARGIDTSFLRSDPTEAVNRVQLARGITDTIFFSDSTPTSTARFPDVVSLPPSVRRYIDLVSALGIMTGNPDGRFDPYTRTNRAEVGKTVAFAISVKVDTLQRSSSR